MLCCRQRTEIHRRKDKHSPTLCQSSDPEAGSSVKALVPFPWGIGLSELPETANKGVGSVEQASCLGFSLQPGSKICRADGDFTVTRDYSIAVYLMLVVVVVVGTSQVRIR